MSAPLNLVDELRKSIIEIKDREFSNIDSPEHFLQGFISYTKSLVHSLAEQDLISHKIEKLKNAYFDNMLQSYQSLVFRAKKVKLHKELILENRAKSFSETLQSISIFIGISTLIFHGFRYVIADPSTSSKIKDTPFVILEDFFSDPKLFMSVLIVFWFSIVVTITLRIITRPNSFAKNTFTFIQSHINNEKTFKTILIATVFCYTAIILYKY